MATASKRKRDLADHGVQPSHPSAAYAPYMSSNEHDMDVVNALTGHNDHGADQLNDGRPIHEVETAPMHFGIPEHQASAYLAQAQQALNQDNNQDPNFNIDPAVSERPVSNAHEQGPKAETDDIDKTNITEDMTGALEEGDTSGANVGPGSGVKPKVGSEEWHAFRRSAHKDVERRRRETINDGINALARIVPGAERNNKGGILQRAVAHIEELKAAQQQAEQKAHLERMMFEQSIAEMTNTADKLKADLKQMEEWKRVAEGAGLRVDGS